MTQQHLVIVMPAYNEADGISGFLAEIREHVAPLVERLTFVIADDTSTDNTVATISALDDPEIVIEPQPTNRGHGPTALAAYRAGLRLDPDLLIHVDGDGQFLGEDFPRVLAATGEQIDVVRGVRITRTDPWFRQIITFLVRLVVSGAAGRRIPDVNTPLRAYRPQVLRVLLDAVGPDAEVPHVHFSLAEARWGLRTVDIEVQSIPRRGETETGTMWGRNATPKLPPKRLRQFVWRAGQELWRVSMRPGAPMRRNPFQERA